MSSGELDEHELRQAGALWEAAMRRGDWEDAWRQTDRIELPRRARQRHPGFARRPHELRWDGTAFAGRSVLVRGEHGLGDTLQFMRYLPLLAREAHEVHVLVQPHLMALLKDEPGLGRVRNGWTDEPVPSHDVDIEIMELAYAFRSTTTSVPPPYRPQGLRPAGALQLPCLAGRGPRVGLLWAASDWGPSRSIELPLLEPLLQCSGARFFSLQQGPAAEDPRVAQCGLEPLARHTREIAAAAAAILSLDLVITVDAMLAHLAGTLGCPTWLMLKHEADWRWMDGRADSPWYPSMRLFRQPQPGDWPSVVASVTQALRAFRSPA